MPVGAGVGCAPPGVDDTGVSGPCVGCGLGLAVAVEVGEAAGTVEVAVGATAESSPPSDAAAMAKAMMADPQSTRCRRGLIGHGSTSMIVRAGSALYRSRRFAVPAGSLFHLHRGTARSLLRFSIPWIYVWPGSRPVRRRRRRYGRKMGISGRLRGPSRSH